jgi:hypothetical protein
LGGKYEKRRPLQRGSYKDEINAQGAKTKVKRARDKYLRLAKEGTDM